MRQGMRNAMDAISLLQVADGSLGIIDEKLIRMKELAEQASTGTYNSDQRLMIDSEFQAMASEIERIAQATQFNGIKMLNWQAGEESGGGAAVRSRRVRSSYAAGDYTVDLNGTSSAVDSSITDPAAYLLPGETSHTYTYVIKNQQYARFADTDYFVKTMFAAAVNWVHSFSYSWNEDETRWNIEEYTKTPPPGDMTVDKGYVWKCVMTGAIQS